MFALVDSFDIIGFGDDDLERVKNDIVSSYYGVFESVESKASLINEYTYIQEGKAFNLQDDIDRYRRVTREDVLRVYRRYLKNRGASVVIIEPDPRKFTDPNFKPTSYQSVNPNANVKSTSADAEYAGLTYKRPVDAFDRALMPAATAAKPVTIPSLSREKLSNGLEIAVSQSTESPLVFMSFNIDGGHLLEGSIVKNGTASMTAEMMSEGTTSRSSEKISQELEKLGSSINFGAGNTGTNISVACLRENLDKTMEILEDMLFNPAFPKTEFDRNKKQSLEQFNFIKNNRSQAASNAWSALMNAGTPLATMASGMQKDVEKLTIADLKAFHAKYYAPELTKVVVVGNVSQEEAMKALSFLNKWKTTGAAAPAVPTLPKWESNHVFMVDFPNSEQSEIRIGFNALPYDASGEFFRSTLMNFPLGGNFNSRINLNLREEKAWTYGSRGGFTPAYKNLSGNWIFSSSVRASATDSAIVEVVKEINNFKQGGMTAEEFNFTRNSVLANQALEFESNMQKSGFIYNILNRNLPDDYTRQQEQVLKGITMDELNQLAAKYLSTDRMVILVVGDAATLKPRLEKLGYGKVQMLDAFGQGKWTMKGKYTRITLNKESRFHQEAALFYSPYQFSRRQNPCPIRLVQIRPPSGQLHSLPGSYPPHLRLCGPYPSTHLHPESWQWAIPEG
jgi:zinc protease